MNWFQKFAKNIILVFNFVFFLTGVGILVMGAILAGQANYVSLIGYREFDICIVMIVAGAVTTTVCAFGCCGAMKQSTCLLFTFSTLLVCVVALEIGGSITAFAYQDDIKTDITKEMNSTLPDYKPDDPDDQMSWEWDELQEKYSCCGPSGDMDWYYAGQPLPKSCCYPISHDYCDYGKEDHYTDGCVDAVYDNVSDHVWLLAGLGIAIAVIQILGIAISCYLARSIKRNKRLTS